MLSRFNKRRSYACYYRDDAVRLSRVSMHPKEQWEVSTTMVHYLGVLIQLHQVNNISSY